MKTGRYNAMSGMHLLQAQALTVRVDCNCLQQGGTNPEESRGTTEGEAWKAIGVARQNMQCIW